MADAVLPAAKTGGGTGDKLRFLEIRGGRLIEVDLLTVPGIIGTLLPGSTDLLRMGTLR